MSSVSPLVSALALEVKPLRLKTVSPLISALALEMKPLRLKIDLSKLVDEAYKAHNQALFYVYQHSVEPIDILRENSVKNILLKSGSTVSVTINSNILTASSNRFKFNNEGKREERFHIFSSQSNIGKGTFNCTYSVSDVVKRGEDRFVRVPGGSRYVIKRSKVEFFRNISQEEKEKLYKESRDKYNRIFSISRRLNYLHTKFPVLIDCLDGIEAFFVEYDLREKGESNSIGCGDLKTKIQSDDFKRLDWSERLELIYRTIVAMFHLHKLDIYWTDAKPGNMIQREENIYLIDFGDSLLLSTLRQWSPQFSELFSHRGTRTYASPEMYVCHPHGHLCSRLHPRSDIFALGVIIARDILGAEKYNVRKIKVGCIPYEANGIGDGLNGIVPDKARCHFQTFIQKMCDHDPDCRPYFPEVLDFFRKELFEAKKEKYRRKFSTETERRLFDNDFSRADRFALEMRCSLDKLFQSSYQEIKKLIEDIKSKSYLDDEDCLKHFIFILSERSLSKCQNAKEVSNVILIAYQKYHDIKDRLKELLEAYGGQEWARHHKDCIRDYEHEYPLNSFHSLDNMIALTEKLNKAYRYINAELKTRNASGLFSQVVTTQSMNTSTLSLAQHIPLRCNG